jgi:hypothetical protein
VSFQLLSIFTIACKKVVCDLGPASSLSWNKFSFQLHAAVNVGQKQRKVSGYTLSRTKRFILINARGGIHQALLNVDS